MVGLVTCGLGVIFAFLLQNTYLKDIEDAPSLLGGVGFIVGLCVCGVMVSDMDIHTHTYTDT